MFTYLLLNLGTIFFPVLFSFEKKVYFFSKWRYALPAIAVTACYFLIWDYFFTRMGIWSFNPQYLVDVYLAGLPLEEVLFFICIPFACLFIYAILRDFVLKDFRIRYFNLYLFPFILMLLVTGIVFWQQSYTAVTCITAALFLSFLAYYLNVSYLPVFFAMYLVHLLPFVIINGILTALPVVIYHADYNSGIRIGTIPAEDTIYSMLLLLMNVSVYEAVQHKKDQV